MLSEVNESQHATTHPPDPVSFYRTRQRISMGLLIFVVVAGLPIVGVPSLRHRLSTRVSALKSALSGEIKPVTLEVGANHEPFPTEWERSAPPVPHAPELPNLERVFTMKGRAGDSSQSPTLVPAPPIAPAPAPRAPQRRAKIEASIPPKTPAAERPEQPAAPQTASSGESELKYQKGKAEQEAYDVLLTTSPAVASLIQGSNPSLKFKSWDAASRGEDTYWVRLKFQSEGNPDAEYIWQVKVQSKQATPLNYNARSLSQ